VARDVKHLRTVREEFSRQAKSFAQSPTLNAVDVVDRIVEALGDQPRRWLLDVACGPGILLPGLSRRAERVIGLDVTAATLQLARETSAGRGNVELVQALAEPAPFRSGSFDAAVLRLALHHFEHPERALIEVRRLLRDGGRLVVLDLLAADDPEIAALHNAIEILRDPSHCAFETRDSLLRQIGSAGFRVVDEQRWRKPREFREWARIIAAPQRMAALERVLRELSRAGRGAGIDLREEGDALLLTYDWCLFRCDTA
jgi:ubiquinone/menaquinone biosynthesis C-methylase UbiE